jgi:hypothetical protein
MYEVIELEVDQKWVILRCKNILYCKMMENCQRIEQKRSNETALSSTENIKSGMTLNFSNIVKILKVDQDFL